MRLCLVSFFSPLPLEPSIWSEEGNVMHLPVVALSIEVHTLLIISQTSKVLLETTCVLLFSLSMNWTCVLLQ